MSRYRTTEEIYHYDRFKLLVLLLLLAGLLMLILFSDQLGLEPNVAGVPGTGAEVMATPTADAVAGLPGDATVEPTVEAIVATPETPAGEATATPEGTTGVVATPLLIAPQPGTQLTAAEVIFAGTGEPNLGLRALVDGAVAGETTIDAAGNWVLPITLAAGSPLVTLETVDAAGTVVAQSGPYVFDVLEAGTGGQVLPGEGNGGDVVTGIDSNSGTNPFDGRFSLNGTAPAGSVVEVIVDGAVVGQTTADEQGNWTFELVPDGGPFTVQIQVTDPAGTVTTTDPVTTDGPGAAPGLDLPGLVLPTEDGDLQLTVPGGPYAWSGTGLPNTVVDVIINGESAGTATVNEDGNWTLDLNLPPGEHVVRLVTIDPTTGEQLGSTQTTPFTVVSFTRPTVEVPADGWLSGSNTVSGTAPAGATLAVYVNGVAVGEVVADETGGWTTTIELPTGESVVDVRLVGPDGRVVFGSDPVTVLAVGPEPTIGELLTQAGQFNTLLTAAQTTGLDGSLASGGPYTVFAPPDQAFSALPAGAVEGWLANPQYLSTLLLHHIVPTEVTAEAAVQAGTLTTAAGDTLTISPEGGLVQVDGADLLIPNVDASNGIVHVIDRVLLPALPPGVQGPVIDTAGVPTFTGEVLTVVGAAQPGYTILLQVNGQNFGQTAVVDSTGFWLVVDSVTPGRYQIIAYMYDPIGILVGISDPVTLLVR